MHELNDDQKRYTLSVLSGVHQHLEAITELLQGHGLMFDELNRDITPAETAILKAFASDVRIEILDLDRTFHLQRGQPPLSMRRNIDTHLRFAVAELYKLSRPALTHHGPLADDTYRDLQLQIERLQQLLKLEISKLSALAAGDVE